MPIPDDAPVISASGRPDVEAVDTGILPGLETLAAPPGASMRLFDTVIESDHADKPGLSRLDRAAGADGDAGFSVCGARLRHRLPCPAKAGNPVRTDGTLIIGSSASADDDGRRIWRR
jgi:hypothetical protein